MSLRRFYATPESFSDDGARVTLSREESRHLAGVLRLSAGEEVRVFDGEGREFLCAVTGATARDGVLEVRGPVDPPRAESPLALALACALLKGEKFDLVVQKATELGVARILPVDTARADVKPPRGGREGDGSKRVGRWRRIAVEAAKQSGRARVPLIDAPKSLAEVLTGPPPGGTGRAARRLMFAERGGGGIVETAATWDEKPAQVVALVGPEGGWEDAEIGAARESGWQIVTLGGRTLRAETAAIVAVALLQHLCGDLV